MATLPSDYLAFWILIAATTFAITLVLFIPIYWLLSAILRKLKEA